MMVVMVVMVVVETESGSVKNEQVYHHRGRGVLEKSHGICSTKQKQEQQQQRNNPSRMTPLQRLGQSALHRSKSMGCLQSKKLLDEKDNDNDNDNEEAGNGNNDVDVVNSNGPPSSEACPPADREPCLATAMKHRGSEDLIIPDSEDESGEEVDLLDIGGEKVKEKEKKEAAVDLKRFLFTPGG
ncbi:hypothetical protein ACJ72_07686 [Emergomyces africanus]|uniref:Uncharacterized protein n=1 Tax=Emergomyces africanus TaxID=1955775 RepID=A0A1B7NMG0_9EURO|nr:hypothetical protein ACJ72_07686 [Emergomyces africanus]